MKFDSICDWQRPYILAVDDEEINRFLLEDLIENRYELQLIDSGEGCLSAVKERMPELILLDVSMPSMDGFEVCRLLKENPESEKIPVIFLTAKITVEDERKGLQLGAVDYITKPFSESILLARIKTHLSLSRTRKQLEQSHAFLKKERNYIEDIMLSMREDKRFISDQLELLISPVEKSNGDLVLSAQMSNGRRHILIADFTGHGLSAAMAGPLVSSLFYTQALQNIPLEQTMMTINEELFHKLPVELFMAAIFIDWDVESNLINVCNCGMPPLLHFRDGQKIAQYPSNCLALGIVQSSMRQLSFSTLNSLSGDTLFGYSDGVQEVRTSSGNPFGDLRVEAVLSQVIQRNTDLSLVLDTLIDYADGEPIEDDVTLIKVNVP